MKTFNIKQAAAFLGAHKETIRRLASSGKIPATKIGRGWIFIEQDLVMHIRNKYSNCDALQGVNMRSIDVWHSQKRMATGGSTSPMVNDVYAEALGLK